MLPQDSDTTPDGPHDGNRTAFQLFQAHEHRGLGSVLTAIAISAAGDRLYMGLSDGQLEEHRLAVGQTGVRASLGARKHVGKKPVDEVCHLASARRLVILCEGALQLLDHETLEGHPLPGIKGVTAIAQELSGSYPPRLAVGIKTSKRSVRVMVYEVLAGANAGSPFASTALCVGQCELQEALAIKAMAWLGKQLVVCTSLRYLLLNPLSGAATQLFALPEDAPPPTLIQPLPSAQLAVLLMDQVGLVVNVAGQPTQSAFTFPSPPSSLAAAGLYVLAVCSEGVHVYDHTSAAWVQSLPYPDGLRPAPGQALLAAANPRGSCVVVAGFRKVWAFVPVALDEQARELLRTRKYEQALRLAALCARDGVPWADTAFAEAAFLLMHELRFREAMAALQRCSIALFQPLELFPLLPEPCRGWGHPQPAKRYWGLHPPLPPLTALVARFLRRASRNGSSNAASQDARASDGSLSKLDDDGREQALLQEAERCIVDYLLAVRGRDGVEALDGVDSLIVHLLARLGAAGELELFAAAPNTAVLGRVEGVLRERGRLHGLALLCAVHGRADQALQLWKDLAEGTATEALSDSSAMFAAAPGAVQGVAIRHAAALLARPGAVPAPLALAYLPWLLGASPPHCLDVLQARDLPAEEVLALLRPRTDDLRWHYLEHLVLSRGSSDPALHTELALALSEAALRMLPPPLEPEEGVVEGGEEEAGHPLMAMTPRQLRKQRSQSLGLQDELLAEVRGKLQALLRDSALYNIGALLTRLRGTELWEEQVILHQKVGDHMAALRVLALDMGDIVAAEAYCAAHAGQEGYLGLLDMLLHPGAGRQPLYDEACHLLAAQGAQLDPQRVLDALNEDMPLALAVTTLARMMRDRIHRNRHGRIVRNLERAQNLAAAAERVELMSRRVTNTEERACRVCHTRIASKMFAVYPNGVLVCFRCFRRGDPHVCPITGRDFRMAPQDAATEKWPDS